MENYLELINDLKQQFANTTLATQILWLILFLIAFAVFYKHRQSYNFRKPLAAFVLVGGLYTIFTIIMKAKANLLLNEFQPSFTQSKELGQAFVDDVIDLIWMHGVIRSVMLVLMTLGVIYIMNLRFRKKIFAPTHWVYGAVVSLFICSLMITKLKFDFESIFKLF